MTQLEQLVQKNLYPVFQPSLLADTVYGSNGFPEWETFAVDAVYVEPKLDEVRSIFQMSFIALSRFFCDLDCREDICSKGENRRRATLV